MEKQLTQNPMLRVMSLRNFRLLFGGSATSLLGDQFALIATPWLVLQLTGGPGDLWRGEQMEPECAPDHSRDTGSARHILDDLAAQFQDVQRKLVLAAGWRWRTETRSCSGPWMTGKELIKGTEVTPC